MAAEDETSELGAVPSLRDEGDEPASKSAPAGTGSPDDWRTALYPESESGRAHPEAYKHAAAAALHGWDLHRYHTGKDFQLSRADYEAAVKAASEPSDAGAYTPHAAALSEHLAQPEPAQPEPADEAEVKP